MRRRQHRGRREKTLTTTLVTGAQPFLPLLLRLTLDVTVVATQHFLLCILKSSDAIIESPHK